jgi:threonine aldolase
MRELKKLTAEFDVKIHLDGARLFNAALALGVEPAEICEYADSVMLCVSKGLCAPVGSLIAGDAGFIERARKYRTMLGGGMRQAGILAAAGIIAIEKRRHRLHIDHKNAQTLAEGFRELGFGIVNDKPDINMVFIKTNFDGGKQSEYRDYLKRHGVLAAGRSDDVIRFVTNREVSEEDIVYTLRLTKEFMDGFSKAG